ncbi:hypothetical protein ScPMuIL_010334 [Solemya velum]
MLNGDNNGEVRVADDTDFKKLKHLSDDTIGWKQEYCKNNTSVWTRNNENSNFKMVKVRSVFMDVEGDTLYDVLHDPQYRKTWDHSMIEGFEICAVNPNNDIGYYAMKCPSPLKNRDFVTQRSWLVLNNEYMIINHSVNHQKQPPKKGYIRGVSYFTGYLIRNLGDKVQFTYVSHSDPKGKLPAWAVNKVTHKLAPKVIGRIHKACKDYSDWKRANNPQFKPWLFPEQMTLPHLDMTQIRPLSDVQAQCVSSESIDESGLLEDDIDEDDD